MQLTRAKRSKTTQYAIGGIVAVIIIIAWMSLPLMNNSTLDSSVPFDNSFKSKAADVASLGSDIPSESGAPGYSLNGNMINNPATSGEDIAASLFQSGLGEESMIASDSPKAQPAEAGGFSASGGAPSLGVPKGKLNMVQSLSGNNPNTMTTGSTHGKFFGSSNVKADLVPVKDPLKSPSEDKRSALLAQLADAQNRAKEMAVRTGGFEKMKNSADADFDKVGKARSTDLPELGKELESNAAAAGISVGATMDDVARTDPNLNQSKITPPKTNAGDDKLSDEEQFKQMMMQMIVNQVIGPMFGTMAKSAFSL